MLKPGDFITQPVSVYNVITKVECTREYPSIVLSPKDRRYDFFLRFSTHSCSSKEDKPLVTMEDIILLSKAIEYNNFAYKHEIPEIKKFVRELMEWWIDRNV